MELLLYVQLGLVPPPSSSQMTLPDESVVRVPPFVKVEQFRAEMVRPPANVEVEVFETTRLLRVVVPPEEIVPENIPDKVPEIFPLPHEPPEIVGVLITVFVSLSILFAWEATVKRPEG